MRNLSKAAIPTVLEQSASAWLAEYLNDKDSDTKRYRYRDKTIKAALKSETGDKCVYCESKIGHNTPGDVEHKEPTSKVPHKHFDWSNLTIACTECNRRKDDYYSKDSGFLDPYAEDVEACLVHLGPFVNWFPGHARAEKTIRTLDLGTMERKNLIDRKLEVLTKVRGLLDNMKSTGDALLQAMRKDEVARMAAVDAEYSAMVLTFLRQVSEA